MPKTILLFTLLLILQQCVMANSPKSFESISLDQGLSNGYVIDMAIDKNGFVWVATENGLNRILGNMCTKVEWGNPDYANKGLRAVCYNAFNDEIWVAAHNGIFIYDGKGCKIRKLEAKDGLTGIKPKAMTQTKDGNIWISFEDGTIQCYDIKKKKFSTFRINKIVGKAVSLSLCIDDGMGNLYVGTTNNGLYVFSLKKGKAKLSRHLTSEKGDIPNNQVRKVFFDHFNQVWVGTKNGLGLLSSHAEKMIAFRHRENDTTSICGNNIFDILEIDNRLYIATDVGGISILDLEYLSPKERASFKFKNITKFNTNLPSSSIRSVRKDSFGNLWIGCYGTGVSVMSTRPSLFRIFPYFKDGHMMTLPRSVYGISTENDHLWLGGDNEVALFTNGHFSRSWNLGESLSTVNTIYIDSKKHLWIGLNDFGAIRFSPGNGQMIHIGQMLKYQDVHAFLEGKNGKMWIGSDIGLFSYQDGIVTKEERFNSKMTSGTIYTLASDQEGRIWVGTIGGGVFVFDYNGNLVSHLCMKNGFPTNRVNHIVQDMNGGIWVASYEGLIYIPDTKDLGTFFLYDSRKGLKDNNIRAIQQDLQGNIWVSTSIGISCFNVQRRQFYNYDYKNGIPRGSFVEGGTSIDKEGNVYFCSPLGLCYFNPLDINKEKKVSSVQIVSFESLVANGTEDMQKNYISDSKNSIYLDHDRNSIEVSFSVTDFAQVNNVDYMYQMKGLDDKWYDTNGDTKVIFRSLPPGEYVFTIKAKLKNSDWTEATFTDVNIVVNPPVWLTWWAKLLYMLAILGIIIYYILSYRRKLQLKSSLLLAQHKNRQQEELHAERLRFFTNITHELRTPLTLIIGPVQDLADDRQLPERYHKKIVSISKSAERLLTLINEILEFRKTETQNRKLTVAKEDLKGLVEEIGRHFYDLNRNPEVEFSISINPATPPLYYDSEVIETILNNLLSNAIKYTPKGRISLSMDYDAETVNIKVEDTGYGISDKALPYIFDRYFQADSKYQASGTGIGLALVKSLAELHHAQIKVQSVEGQGTRFMLTLSIHNVYPDALHKDDMNETTVDKADSEEKERDNVQSPLVLVVEDNEDIRQYIQESLDADYRVIQAANGKMGETIALDKIPDIIVSDIMMPVMDGIEMTKHLKENILTSHIPIILLTAKTGVSDREIGYNSGADSYLTKPFSSKLLVSRIRNLLSGRRRLAELIAERIDMEGMIPGTPADPKDDMPVLSHLDQQFLEKLNRLIDENIVKTDLDMAFLTDKMAMSHSTFYRKVKALTGMTAVVYIRTAKLHHSMQLLKTGEYNVTEVAYMTGFNNLSHFRESFKKEFGVTPSQVLKDKSK